jgi:hypothetical protein
MPPISCADRQTKPAGQSAWRRFVEKLGPYQALILLLVPTSVVEPLKLIAVAVAGEGHWITGTAMMVAAYAGSLLVVERLFKVFKPKLLTLPWFARLWAKYTSLRHRIGRWMTSLLVTSQTRPMNWRAHKHERK